MPERKTELGRDLQCRADACLALSNNCVRENPNTESVFRLHGKACAYEHSAELADAALPESREPNSSHAPVQDLPDGWTREPNDGYGPVFRDTRPAYRSCAVTVECEDLEQKDAHITTNGDYCIVPVAVLRAFLAALDAK